MKTFPVGEFKAKFSQILEQVIAGNKVGISYGKDKTTIAIIQPTLSSKKYSKRKLGLLSKRKGFRIDKNFEISESDLI